MKTVIEFNQAGKNAKIYKNEILEIISKIISTGTFLGGMQNKKLEENLQTYLQSGYVTTLASGHDALYYALLSLNLKPNDEVIFPVNSYPTAFPISQTVAKIVPADVDINGQMDPEKLKLKINKNTKVIVIVHLYGLVGNIDKIKDIIKGKGIFLIEDCAQAFGSSYKGEPIGTLGDISCFSFYPTKNLATLGDGGAVWTKHIKNYEFIKKAKAYGEEKRYHSEFVSGHSRLPEIQAGILNVYFKNYNQEFKKRATLANYYKKRIIKEGLLNFLRPLKSVDQSNPAYHLFVVEAQKRDGLITFLEKEGISTLIHYPFPVHLVPAFAYLNYGQKSFPVAEKLAKNIISLPFHSLLTEKEIDTIVKTIKKFYV